MKKCILTILATLICLFLFALDITSTAEGGDRRWNSPATWIGGIVPGASDNVIINGSVRVTEGSSCKNLINNGTLINHGNHESLTISERLENNGFISNNGGYLYGPYTLTVKLAGDLDNYGTINNQTIILNNTEPCSLWQDSDAPVISCKNFLSEPTSANCRVLSNLSFSGTKVNFEGRTLILSGDSGTYNLSMSAGSLKNAIIQGGNGATLSLSDNCYLDTVSGNEIVFDGTVRVTGNVSFDTLINNGTLMNHSTDDYVTISERLENNGFISNNGGYLYGPYTLTVKLAGDLDNYGTINNQTIILNNTEPCSLWQDSDAPVISCKNFLSEPTSANCRVLSNLSFSGTKVNFEGRTLILSGDSGTYNLSMSAGSLKNAIIQGGNGATLSLSDNCYLDTVSGNEIVFDGTVRVTGNVSFETLINNGTLMNHSTDDYVTINESLVNYGTIYNSGNYHLTVNLAGDLANYGTIQNRQVNINGTQNQDIRNMGTISVGNFYLVSDIGAAAWYFNDILNTSFQNHAQIGVNVANLGVWQPRNASGDGRLITIGNVALYLSAPENLSSYLSGSVLKLRWDQVPGAVHYNVYYSDLPQGPFTTLLSQVFDNDLSDGFVQTDLSGTEPRRFYQVRAGN